MTLAIMGAWVVFVNIDVKIAFFILVHTNLLFVQEVDINVDVENVSGAQHQWPLNGHSTVSGRSRKD